MRLLNKSLKNKIFASNKVIIMSLFKGSLKLGGIQIPYVVIAVIAALLVGVLVWFFVLPSGENLSFRYLRQMTGGDGGPVGHSKLFMPSKYTELPVGGQGARLGGTSTWFQRGGREGAMDNLRDAASQGFSRPARLDVYQADGPAPADSVSSVVPVNGLMPGGGGQGGANLLGAVPTVGPEQPVLTSQNDRNRDLSGRSDISIPVTNDQGGFNNSSTPTDTRTIDTVPLSAAQGPVPAPANVGAAGAEGLRRRQRRRRVRR